MGADRFLKWFQKPKYMMTFKVIESVNGNYETHTIITEMNPEKFLDLMNKENYKFNVIFMQKL